VVEKDGKLTDIQVKNDPSYVLEDDDSGAEIFKTKKIPGKKASTNFLQIAHHITNELSFNNKAESSSALLLNKSNFKI
jgi:hypothetical protein